MFIKSTQNRSATLLIVRNVYL